MATKNHPYVINFPLLEPRVDQAFNVIVGRDYYFFMYKLPDFRKLYLLVPTLNGLTQDNVIDSKSSLILHCKGSTSPCQWNCYKYATRELEKRKQWNPHHVG